MALLRRAHWRLLSLIAALKWAARDIHAGFVLKPIAGGAPDNPSAESKDPKPEEPAPSDPKDPAPKDPEPPDPKDPDPAKVDQEDDWKTKSRKNETRAKRAERELEEERKKREKREETEKSEHQKALDKARKEGEETASSKAAKERRADRLEVSVTRLASRKVKIGEGDDAEEVRFADPEDALLHIDRAISNGEIDEEDIFDKDGKVDSDALKGEIVDLLERKPHLRESTGSEASKAERKGDPDTGKGDPVDGSLESLSIEDHIKRKYGEAKK